jgi:hypothetical protein
MQKLIDSAPATQWPPPCPLPADSPLRAGFEGPDGSMPIVKDYCFAQRYEGEHVLDWSASYIEGYCGALRGGSGASTYGRGGEMSVALGLARLPGLNGSTGMVLGSEFPWVECMGLDAGAATVWTFEYATIKSTHPRLKAAPVKAMAASHVAGTLPLVDWVIGFSSLEHSGLGRYGDALNPEGDAEAMRQAWCFLKPGGHLVLGLPMRCEHNGYVDFNAHRVYGFKRLAHIAKGFHVVDFAYQCVWNPGGSTSTVILRKPVEGEGVPLPRAEEFEAAATRCTIPVP